ILFTSDLWSDQNQWSFLTITAHWIARVDGTSALTLKLALIAFHHLAGQHTGKMLTTYTIHLLDRAGVTAKVSTTNFHSVAM
ncbi:hypothetical protein EI94DRAFT_1584002, partial [Lactarius quietus]